MLNIVESGRFAFEALKTNKFRTFLTLLGIIIGVAAVIMIGSASKSGRKIVFSELETFGLKSLWIYRSYKEEHPGKTFKLGSGIENDDIEVIRKEVRSVRLVTPVIETRNKWAKYGNRYAKVNLLAVDSTYRKINNDIVFRGRFLLREDIDLRRAACIIGTTVADKLFAGNDPIERHIKIDGNKYTVVGLLKKKDRDFLSSIGSAGGQNANERVIIPISLLQRQRNTKEVNYLQAETTRADLARRAGMHIKQILHSRHNGDFTYETQSMQQYIETADTILLIVSWIGNIAAVLSLIVGGIGIMNVLTTSVVERTKEIGIRRALGARKRHIVQQFLIEGVAICLIGGHLGAALGTGTIIAARYLTDKPIFLDAWYILISISISIVVGVLSGLYPAIRAASMDPVEALRFE